MTGDARDAPTCVRVTSSPGDTDGEAHAPAGLHPSTATYDESAEAYERGRPSYSGEALDHLVDMLAISAGTRVCDVAAGTGKLTRELVRLGAAVTAVEPVAGMRGALRARLPDIDVRDGTAEGLPLADASVDAVTVAQAFHWFDPPAALAEFHRVLVPGGRLGLIWNVRDPDDALEAAISGLVEPYRDDTPRMAHRRWEQPLVDDPHFGDHRVHRWPLLLIITEDRLVDRVLSISFVGQRPDSDRARIESSVRRLFAQHATDGTAPFAHIVEVHTLTAV